MSDNTTINAGTGGDVIATNDVGGYKIQRINLVIGVEGTDGGNVSSSNPLPTTSNGTVFAFSSVNSTSAQLASSASFVGTIESIINQQSCSILLVSDVSIQLTLNQFIDAGGTRLASQWLFNVVGGVPYSRSFPINGNYFQAIAQNTSGVTSTTLRLDVAYGTIPSATNLGNTPVAINEIGSVTNTLPYVPVGGSVAAGVTQTMNPLPAGGVDGSGYARQLLVDSSGRLQVSNNLSASIAAAAASPFSVSSNYVTDTSQFEGQFNNELFAQILLELRILNQQIYELPNLIALGLPAQDEPQQFRLDPTIFDSISTLI